MTVWILHQLLSPEEEATIEQRERLLLPFDGVPDLSQAEQLSQLTQMLRALHPDAPHEAISRKAEHYWQVFEGMQPEDLIAVPLHARREIALASLAGRYGYAVGVNGEDTHSIGVRWQHVRIPLVKLGKHKPLFENYRERMIEVADADARNALRRFLPHSYNRFAKWKWLLVLLFAIQIISMLLNR